MFNSSAARPAASLWTLALVLALSACGEDESGLPEAPVNHPTLAPTPAPAADPDHEAILAAFENFIRAGNRAANDGDAHHPDLPKFAGGQALIQTQSSIQRNSDRGWLYQGELVIATAEVTEVDFDVPPPMPNATVVACLDPSDYVLVEASDLSPVNPGRATERFVTTVKLRHLAEDDRWIVDVAESDADEAC